MMQGIINTNIIYSLVQGRLIFVLVKLQTKPKVSLPFQGFNKILYHICNVFVPKEVINISFKNYYGSLFYLVCKIVVMKSSFI